MIRHGMWSDIECDCLFWVTEFPTELHPSLLCESQPAFLICGCSYYTEVVTIIVAILVPALCQLWSLSGGKWLVQITLQNG